MGLSQTLGFILSHPMNRGRPISTLARFASWQVRSRLQDEVIFDWIGGAKLAVRRGMTGATGNIYCGLHEYVDMSFVLHTLKPGDLFVDIGANVGSYTVLAAKVCGADVIAVEPDPETARALRRNIEINGISDRVEIVEAALGARTGVAWFTKGLDTTNKVVDEDTSAAQEVELTTLDAVLDGRSPALLKLDVEGYEGEVLAGANEALNDPGLLAVITETFDPAVKSIVDSVGLHEFNFDPATRTCAKINEGEASQNTLLVRDLSQVNHRARPG